MGQDVEAKQVLFDLENGGPAYPLSSKVKGAGQVRTWERGELLPLEGVWYRDELLEIYPLILFGLGNVDQLG
ncbi:hypothetical protein GCM10011378_09630 [Hymenobacter glacieicola]|uniref:Uncharacterized protein n=1 Tax=Hymenobacter glacieicola TaxID=1562124 RepID=A0ABQ1WN95_9BACT|nr:hypothetical protein GCM10011378_09630 [Hymenobacter glacieicola]